MSTPEHDAAPKRLAISAKDLAKELAVSERHLWAMHADGRLGPQPVALGRAKRWYLEEIRQWLAAGAPTRSVWHNLRQTSSPCSATATQAEASLSEKHQQGD